MEKVRGPYERPRMLVDVAGQGKRGKGRLILSS